ncbi:MAG: hypothetical protein JW836_07485 [Deltaproteobacteria bacterium]|nr:hypothetical protein [Deltaproteobacteria bacterium]
MACNFKIVVRRNSGSLHLDLAGDFDGSSAFELLNTLNDNINGASRIIVQTESLKGIHPFGSRVLESHLRGLKRRGFEILFTGDKAKLIFQEEAPG